MAKFGWSGTEVVASNLDETGVIVNWKALGQISAASGVVLSLLFVGYEIRQNTAVARMSAAQAFTQQIIDINAILMSDGFSDTNVRAMSGASRSEFAPEEQFELDMVMLSLLRVWESLFRSVEVGIVDAELLEPLGGSGPSPWTSPYFLESWPQYRDAFTGDFAEYFEQVRGL